MRRSFVISILFLSVVAACEKAPRAEDETSQPELTVLIGTDGFGDGCYNDNMLAGILRFSKAHPDVKLSLQQPSSIADAGKRLDAWLAADDPSERALILASNSYDSILKGKPAPRNGRVLAMETDEVFPGHSSYIIRRYGAAWLSGAMSGDFLPIIIKAMDGNDMIDESEQGFSDGFAEVKGKRPVSRTVADGPEGFTMRDSTYRLVYQILRDLTWDSHPFIFPLVGGSIAGVFDYSRYVGFTYIAGMDVDCSSYDPEAVPYSLIVGNDRILERYLEDWLAGTPWPEHESFGLESGYVGLKVNPAFAGGGVGMQALFKQYYPMALEKEKAYEVE